MHVVFSGILASALVIALFVTLIIGCVKLLHRMLVSRDEASSGEEAKLLQELNTKMNRLEKRIESLETIVTSVDGSREGR